ncbi:MAG: Ppx/GppA family phosphatase [Acidobacteria bacterium]|nr:Ppx/GppA family phosphatase [Acidobacteriota bacterium]
MKSRKRNLAAIDIGTNSFHLVVAEADVASGRFRTLARDKEIVRLGAGATDMKHLGEEAIARGIGVLRRFADMAAAYGAPVRAVATSAVREALNREEFIRRARVEAGIGVEIASGAEEARLIHLGVLQALPVMRKTILLMDIGGGSTELLLGKGRRVFYANSVKLGAVRLTQRFFPSEAITRKAVRQCREYVRGMLGPVVREIRSHSYDLAVGTSGTLMNLAGIIALRRSPKNSASLNGFRLTAGELYDVAGEILAKPTSSERLGIAGLDPKRADIIPAGAILAECLFQECGLEALTLSDFGLREGVLLDSIEKMHPRKRSDPLRNLRLKSSLHLAENCRYEKMHARQVARLALELFDRTRRLHGLGEEEREFLESAALLHEIGLFVSHDAHHRHSYYLIRNAELAGFTENEKAVVANIARYHRKSLPKVKHEGFRLLSPRDRERVTRLSSLLRIADGLDRSHASAVEHVHVRRNGRRLSVTALCRRGHDPALERWGAERNQELFERTFGLEVRVSIR